MIEKNDLLKVTSHLSKILSSAIKRLCLLNRRRNCGGIAYVAR